MGRTRAFVDLHRPLDGLPLTVLPATGLGDAKPFGVKAGRRVKRARLFRRTSLPAGWQVRGNAHGMPTHVVDQYDRTRLTVFWSTLDPRESFTDVESVRAYVVRVARHGEPLAFDPVWATRAAILDEVMDQLTFARESLHGWRHDVNQHGDHAVGDFAGRRGWTAARQLAESAYLVRVYESLLSTVATAPDVPGLIPWAPPRREPATA